MNNVHTLRRRLPVRALAALALAVPVLALAACGGEDNVPGNAVAKVDDKSIEKTTFDHWMRIAAISQTGPPAGKEAPQPKIPAPPDFTECIAELKRTSPKPPKGQPKPTDDQFKAQCKQQYEGLRDQVMQLLIQYEWVVGEADEQGIKVTEDEVKKAFEEQKKSSFPKEKDYQEFLRTSGFTESDILFRVRLEQLSNKLREKVVKGKDKVTEDEVKTYYDKNKQRFAQPERRDLRVVLTKTEERANEAKSALEDGQSWKTVAKRYSIDQASKNQGGTLRAVAKGQQEPSLDKAVFEAEKGQLEGPIKTQFGFYVFQVQKITPATQQSLDEARETIEGIVKSENQQKALDDFIKDFREKWKGRTQCREGYITADCDNFQEPKTTGSTAPPGAVQGAPPVPQGAPPGATPGAPPQGAPPQGAPPQGAPPQGAPPQGAPPGSAPPPQG